MKPSLAALFFVVGGVLGACNSSPAANDQPVTGNQPVATDSVVAVDTTSVPSHGAIPFVAPTKIGRILGSQSPSPPASRTR